MFLFPFFLFVSFLFVCFGDPLGAFSLFPSTEHCTETTLCRHRVPPRSSVCDRRLRRTVQAQLCRVPGLHCRRGRGLVHRRHHECAARSRRCHHTRRFVILIEGFVPKLVFKSENFTPYYWALCRYDLCRRGL